MYMMEREGDVTGVCREVLVSETPLHMDFHAIPFTTYRNTNLATVFGISLSKAPRHFWAKNSLKEWQTESLFMLARPLSTFSRRNTSMLGALSALPPPVVRRLDSYQFCSVGSR